MKIIGCQLDIVWENKRANCDKVRALLESTQVPAGSMLVLPEMFATGFSMEVERIFEGHPSPTEAFLAALAQERQAVVLGGIVTKGADGRGRNEAVALGADGKVLTRYQKIHPFTLGGESRQYGGGLDVVVFDSGGFRIAPFVCYDLRFPEVFRVAVRRGAQLFVIIANWPVKRVNHWITLLQARAIENQAYVVGVNRCGTDPKLTYPGRSLIIDPHGGVLADAGEKEGLVMADLDPAAVTAWRQEFPALLDIRERFVAGG